MIENHTSTEDSLMVETSLHSIKVNIYNQD